MLRTAILVLSLGAMGWASPNAEVQGLGRRQDLGAIMGLLGGIVNEVNAKVAKTETLPPVLRPDAKRERIWFGPFTLPAQTGKPLYATKQPLQMDPNSLQLNKQLSGFCSNCTVLYGKGGVIYENGTVSDVTRGIYIHHVVMVDMAKRTTPFYLCEGQKGFLGMFPASGFIVSGNDEAANLYTTPDGKFNSGYAIGASSRVVMQAELINYRPEPQKIYITAEIEYLPGMNAEADATLSLFSVTGCDAPDYHVPKDQPVYNVSSAIVPMPLDGHIINAKGHLHDGGVNIILTLNGKTVCDSQAKYELDPKATGTLTPTGKKWEVITKMTQCTEPIEVKKGDKLQMVTYYDNTLHPPRHDASGKEDMHGSGDSDEMGVFFINFAAKKSALKEAKKTVPW